MQSTVPLSHYHNFGIHDKGDPRKESKRAEMESPHILFRKTHTKSPGRIELPGPPIRIKGLPQELNIKDTNDLLEIFQFTRNSVGIALVLSILYANK